MCGRYGFSVTDAKELYERFDVDNELLDYHPRYQISPGQFNPVITRHSPNHVQSMLWGLIPHWAKDETMKWKTINARAETVATSPSFRKPFRLQRCLVPATHFFEWDKNKQPSQPYCIKLKQEQIFSFAGLYDVWHDPKTGRQIQSYTIITCPPNALMAPIHNRMPVIVHREDEETWLNPDSSEPERLQPLLRPYPDAEMEAYPVSRAVNNPRNDSSAVIQPVDGKE
jgi:putative SOS response-associated peptidase YedK